VPDVRRWTQIKTIFNSATQLTGAQRDAYLSEACASDKGLRVELDSLLATYEASAGFLEDPALAAAGDLVEAAIPDPQLGRHVGSYLLIRRIGEGGMGVVYEALGTQGGSEDQVAVKLIRRGMDSEYILTRFCKERQILAALAHPNIARLIDGGMAEDGSPYFVMEFIDGEPIDAYCRSHSLPLPARVELIRQICDAVEYAHKQRVIHRDIKPGNIMVDRLGRPKLLDFGIAKLITAEGSETSQRTATELRMITPDYASPEQIRGRPATERSDIYAMGVVLDELASGRAPRSATAKPKANIPRDLQIIIDKATHDDVRRRYSTVSELAADLGNFISGKAISARPDSIFYRASRSVRSHSNVVWAASLIVVTLATAFFSWFLQSGTSLLSNTRRSVAVMDFQNITGSAASEWLSTALTEMLDAEISSGGAVRVIPGDAVAQLRSDLRLRPVANYPPATLRRISANLHPDYIVAGSYLATGGKSDMLVRVDLRLQDVRKGDSLIVWSDTGTPAELPAIATRAGARLRHALGITAAVPMLSPRFASAEGTRLYAEGLNRLRSFDPLGARVRLERAVVANPSDPLSHAALATALSQLGYEDRATGEAKRALDLSSGLTEAQKLEVEARYYTIRRDWTRGAAAYKALWTKYPDDLDYGIQLANAQSNGGDFRAARESVVQIRRNPAGATDPRVDLAEALAAEIAGEPRKELDLARSAASKARQTEAAETLAEALYYEGWAEWLVGDLHAAEQTYAEALSLFVEIGNQRRVVDVKSGMATVLLDQGKAAESAQILEEGLAIAQKLGERSLEGMASNNLARCWEEMGQLRKARSAYERTVAIDKEINDRSNLATALLNVGGVLRDQGEFILARQRTTEALEIARALGKKTSIAMALSNLGDESLELGDLSDASQFQSEALSVAREIGRKTSVAAALSGEAAILRSEGKWQQAERRYDEAARVASEAGAQARLAEIRIHEAGVLADEGKLPEAASLARQALQEFSKENSSDSKAFAEATLAQIVARQGLDDEFRRLATSARQDIGAAEVLITRLEVEKAEALRALTEHKKATAVLILRRVSAEAGRDGLQEIAWDVDLLINEIEPTAAMGRIARQDKRQATAKGILRIPELTPRLSAVV
jgi:serine/threonine-protein kinase